MNLKDVEQEMTEESKKPKEEGKVTHLLPAHAEGVPFAMGEGWKKENGVWRWSPPEKEKEEEKKVEKSTTPFQETRSTIHYPHSLNPPLNRDTYRGEEEEIISSFQEEGSRLVVVVDEDTGRASYMNQDRDGHLGAVERDWPFWSRPSDSYPFD